MKNYERKIKKKNMHSKFLQYAPIMLLTYTNTRTLLCEAFAIFLQLLCNQAYKYTHTHTYISIHFYEALIHTRTVGFRNISHINTDLHSSIYKNAIYFHAHSYIHINSIFLSCFTFTIFHSICMCCFDIFMLHASYCHKWDTQTWR